MQKNWRVYTLINSRLRAWGFPYYLEIGIGDGTNIRNVIKHTEGVGEKLIPRDWCLWQYQMTVDSFFELVAKEKDGIYGVIYLREWNNENLESRILKCYDMLTDGGMLVLHGLDPKGIENDSWKVAVSLKKQGLVCGIVQAEYLTVYKSSKILNLKPGISLSKFKSDPKKYLP